MYVNLSFLKYFTILQAKNVFLRDLGAIELLQISQSLGSKKPDFGGSLAPSCKTASCHKAMNGLFSLCV